MFCFLSFRNRFRLRTLAGRCFSLTQKCCSIRCTKLQKQKHFTGHYMGTTFLNCIMQLEPVKQLSSLALANSSSAHRAA